MAGQAKKTKKTEAGAAAAGVDETSAPTASS